LNKKPAHKDLEKRIQELEQAEFRHKRTKNALEKSERDLKRAQRISKIGSWEFDWGSGTEVWSDECFKLYGLRKEDYPGNIVPDAVNLTIYEDPEETEKLDVSLAEENDRYELEYNTVPINGRVKTIHSYCEVERDNNGNILKVFGTDHDITKRKRAEEALKESRERVELALKGTNLGLWDWDIESDRVILDVKALNFIKPAPKNSKDWFDLTHPDDLQKVKESDEALIAGLTDTLDYEYRIMAETGDYRWIHGRGSVVEWDSTGKPKRATGTIKDITKQKQAKEEKARLETELRQAQKMESIGTLAGGIAHDFNNILFPVLGHTEMLLQDIPEDDPIHRNLERIYTGASRAKELVKQILTFSRQEKSELKLMQIEPVVREALKFIRSSIPTTIGIKQDISEECSFIKADPTQIHQIVMNLTTNAYHAMERTGGELRVAVKEITLGKSARTNSDMANSDMKYGEYVMLSVADTGKGMDKELTEKIFDPFFTTKEVGKGTGMGLSLVHGIIKNMNGSIQIFSEPGKGTEFNVYFPVEMKNYETEKIQIGESVQTGAEHILLIDDEEAILTMEKEMLERLGYMVTPVADSIEALEVFRRSPDTYDMVITDLAMPTMPGNKLSTELIKIRPDISILLCTGFSETMSKETVSVLGIKDVLLKPIVMKDLALKIREIVDETNCDK